MKSLEEPDYLCVTQRGSKIKEEAVSKTEWILAFALPQYSFMDQSLTLFAKIYKTFTTMKTELEEVQESDRYGLFLEFETAPL